MTQSDIGIVEIADCPNPWCDQGVQGIDHREGGFFRVSCTCGVGGPASTSEDEAVKLWNTRDPIITEMVEALEGLLGLLDLIHSRTDLPSDFKPAMWANHRVITAQAVIAKVRGK